MDGAGSYSIAHRTGLLPTELTGMWGWILLRSPHQGRGSPSPAQPLPLLSKGLPRPQQTNYWAPLTRKRHKTHQPHGPARNDAPGTLHVGKNR